MKNVCIPTHIQRERWQFRLQAVELCFAFGFSLSQNSLQNVQITATHESGDKPTYVGRIVGCILVFRSTVGPNHFNILLCQLLLVCLVWSLERCLHGQGWVAEYGFTFLPSHPLPTGLPADCRSWLSTDSLVNGFIQTKIPQISDKPTTGDRKVAAENRKACIAILIGGFFFVLFCLSQWAMSYILMVTVRSTPKQMQLSIFGNIERAHS